MFNSGASRRVLEQRSSCDGSQRRAARLGKTAVSSMRISVEDVDEGRRERDHAVGMIEVKGGEGGPSAGIVSTKSGKTSKGWEYWSYRALLLGVAAIWGTNFPVVSVATSHFAINGNHPKGRWHAHCMRVAAVVRSITWGLIEQGTPIDYSGYHTPGVQQQ